TGTPDSACFRIDMIWLSVKRDFRMWNLLSDQVTKFHLSSRLFFGGITGQTRQWKTSTLGATDFLWLVLEHVLPKGFHQVRDYGLLHCTAWRIRQRVQLLLKVSVPETNHGKPKPVCTCTSGGTWQLVHRNFPEKTRMNRTSRMQG
ncbi:MAG: transposase, partial [Saccharospirillum sp.]